MPDEILLEAEEKMEKAVENAKEQFSTIRTGRATAAMFAKIVVDYYGAPTPIQQVASFQFPEARTVVVTPYDKSAMSSLEEALRNSDLGVNPSNNGDVLRIVLPALTEERRKDYVKLARGKAEDARISVRNIRRSAKDGIDKMVKDKEIGEDEGARAEKELESITKKYVEAIDAVLHHKESELLEV
ncbi:ribosome recycling factor [Micrococcales bacterium 31B]|nr:ribosome recycling factor [Micrococcales bacterium 31B]